MNNSYTLRILGSAELDAPLDMDKDIDIKGAKLRIKSTEKRDNSDGSFTYCYKTAIVSAIDLEQNTKKLRGENKNRKSQKLRQACWVIKQDDGYYDIFIGKLLANLEDVIDFLCDK